MRFTFLNLLFLILTANLLACDASAMQVSRSSAAVSASSWKNLSLEQKQALNSLANEWDSMDAAHQKKWLGIANKYSSMSAAEKLRVEERIKAWVKLTPKQRMNARENFSKSPKMASDKKSEQWQQYQQLSKEEKEQLAKKAQSNQNTTQFQVKPSSSPIQQKPSNKN